MFSCLKKISLILAAIIFFVAGLLLYSYFHNFHTVIPNQVYRSRQLTKSEFISVIHQYRLRAIVNLRGANPDTSWYQQEMAAVKATKIQHYNISLHSKQMPNAQIFNQLVSILTTAQRPLLIHCQSGIDRSGFVSALILILANNHSMPVIEQQVSPEYFVFSNASIGRQFLRQYKLWLQHKQLITSRDNFLLWLKDYR